MAKKKETLNNQMRIWHRYLGFFLAGIMAIYSISGIILIFRQTDFLKSVYQDKKTLKPELAEFDLQKELRINQVKFENPESEVINFTYAEGRAQPGSTPPNAENKGRNREGKMDSAKVSEAKSERENMPRNMGERKERPEGEKGKGGEAPKPPVIRKGTYNAKTGEVNYEVKRYPTVIEKMTHLHKATTKDPLYWLNIFFGVSLFFFVISSFFMFMPGNNIFKKGMYYTLAGIVLTLIMLFV